MVNFLFFIIAIIRVPKQSSLQVFFLTFSLHWKLFSEYFFTLKKAELFELLNGPGVDSPDGAGRGQFPFGLFAWKPLLGLIYSECVYRCSIHHTSARTKIREWWLSDCAEQCEAIEPSIPIESILSIDIRINKGQRLFGIASSSTRLWPLEPLFVCR